MTQSNCDKFPKIMGIMNITPDSFSDGGEITSIDQAIRKVEKWKKLGVDIIDIGGESSRPGALSISETEEINRVLPYITAISSAFPNITISIDTTKFEVAKAAISAGASIINDISGLQYDIRLAQLAADKNVALVIMHIQGNPQTMHIAPKYDNLIDNIFSFLKERISIANNLGVRNIIADIGIGFGKTFDDNWKLLQNIDHFKMLGVPLLVGISRKRFIGDFLSIDNPKERDMATILIHSILLNKQIDIIRVHNVDLSNQLKSIFNMIYSSSK